MPDLFTYDPDQGLEYDPAGEESVTHASDSFEGVVEGDSVAGSVPDPEVPEQSLELSTVPDDGSDLTVYVQQIAELQAAAYAVANPVSGSLASSTLDYFERVVNGLPSDYTYVAYKASDSDFYAGVLIYGKHVDVSGDTVIFGDGAVELRVSRTSSGGTYYIHYNSADASGSSVPVSHNGTILYYTNGLEGFPTLGAYRSPSVLPPLLAAVFFGFVLSFILRRFFRRD
jgi:hypothetical protein